MFTSKPSRKRKQQELQPPNLGCSCLKCKCSRNYCACYTAKIACTIYCRCIGCHNYEEHPDFRIRPSKTRRRVVKAGSRSSKITKTVASQDDSNASGGIAANNGIGPRKSTGKRVGGNQPVEGKRGNFITPEVVDATIECLLTQAGDSQNAGLSLDHVEKRVLIEIGRCIEAMIDIVLPNAKDCFNQQNMA